jgi:hypothetical protein
MCFTVGVLNIAGDHWIGLDVLHWMTNSETYNLVIDLYDSDGRSVGLPCPGANPIKLYCS